MLSIFQAEDAEHLPILRSTMKASCDYEMGDDYLSFQYLVLSLPGIYTQLFSKTVMLQDIYPL